MLDGPRAYWTPRSAFRGSNSASRLTSKQLQDRWMGASKRPSSWRSPLDGGPCLVREGKSGHPRVHETCLRSGRAAQRTEFAQNLSNFAKVCVELRACEPGPPASRESTNMSDADLSTTNNACRPSIRAWISLTVVYEWQGVAERGIRCASSVVLRFFSAGMGPSDSFHRRPTVHGSDGGSRSKRGRNESARGAMPPWIAGGDC